MQKRSGRFAENVLTFSQKALDLFKVSTLNIKPGKVRDKGLAYTKKRSLTYWFIIFISRAAHVATRQETPWL